MNKTILAGLCALLVAAGAAHAQSTAFGYQGRLNSTTNAATGLYDFSFNLYATSNGFPALTASNGVFAVPVSNGLFSVTLDFGNQFPGADRWLEIAVRSNGFGVFATLAPRQPLTPTPYAIRAASAGTATTATTATTANSVATGAVNGTALAGNAVDSSKIADGSIAAGDLSSALLSNTFWRLAGNAGTTPGVNFLGTTDDRAVEVKVNNTRALRLEPTAFGTPNVIGGASNSVVRSGTFGAAIAGGESHTVGTAYPAIGGGYLNAATNTQAVVAGGAFNVAGGYRSAVGGGEGNLAGGQYSTVPGGQANSASGDYSFSAGRRAKAVHQGTLVLADSQDANFTSTSSNQFLVRASGGMGIGTTTPRGTLEVKTDVGSIIFLNDDGYAPGITVSNSPNEGVLRFRHRFEVWPNPSGTESGVFDVRNASDAVTVSLPGSGDGYFTAGKFGIGTTSPGSSLEVNGGIRARGGAPGGGGVNNKGYAFDGTSGDNDSGMFSSADGQLEFYGNAQERMRVTSGGNIGIGKTDPATALDVNGTVTASQFSGPLNGSLSGTFNGGVSASSFKLGSSSIVGSVLAADDALGNTRWESSLRIERTGDFAAPNILAGLSANQASNGIVGATISGGGRAPGFFPLVSLPNYVGGDYATVSGGLNNIAGGYAATVPGGQANRANGAYSFAAGVNAQANYAGTFVWSDTQGGDFASTGDNQFLIRAAGGVGINTSTPGSGLEVNGGIRAAGGAPGSFGSLNHGYAFSGNGGDNDSGMFSSADGQIEFYANASERMRIASSGNVGVGTSNPQAKLEVNGDVRVNDHTLHLRGGSDSNHGLRYRSSFGVVCGNVGVDGPALYGWAGGVLGTTDGGEKWALRWNKDEVRVRVLTIEGGCDIAEPFPMKDKDIEAGSVVVIDDEHPGDLKVSAHAYDTRVAGIVSGAGGVNTGLALRQEGVLDTGKNVALTGRVYVKADATQGTIRPGDLLTTSERPGHAMKVADHTRSQGAILGKAMSALNEGTGLVLVLVTLQ